MSANLDGTLVNPCTGRKMPSTKDINLATTGGSAGMARNPEEIVNLGKVTASEKEEILGRYYERGYSEAAFAGRRNLTPPFSGPAKMKFSLTELARKNPESDCPVIGFMREAYDKYIDGFKAGMTYYFPHTRYNPPTWDEADPAVFLSLAELRSALRREKAV